MRLICSALGLLVTTGSVVGRLSYSDKATPGLETPAELNRVLSNSCTSNSIGCDLGLLAASPSRLKSKGAWPIHMHARFDRRQAPEPSKIVSSESSSKKPHEQDFGSDSRANDDQGRHSSTEDTHEEQDQTETIKTHEQPRESESGSHNQPEGESLSSADLSSTDSQSETKESSATDKSSDESSSGAHRMRSKTTRVSDSKSDQDAPTEPSNSPTSREADGPQTTAVDVNEGGTSKSKHQPKHRTSSEKSSEQRPTKVGGHESSMPQTSSGAKTTRHNPKSLPAKPSKTRTSHHFTDSEPDLSSSLRQTHHIKQSSTRSKTDSETPSHKSLHEPESTSWPSNNSDSEPMPEPSSTKRKSDSDNASSSSDIATFQGRKKHGHHSIARASGSFKSSDQIENPSHIEHKSRISDHPTQVSTRSSITQKPLSSSLAAISSPSQSHSSRSSRPSSNYGQSAMSTSKGTHSRSRYHPTNSPYNHPSHSRGHPRITSIPDTQSNSASKAPRFSHKAPDGRSRTPTSSSSASQATKTSPTGVADHSIHSSLQKSVMSESASQSAYPHHSIASSHVLPYGHRGGNESSIMSATTRAPSPSRPIPTYLTTSVSSLKPITTYGPSQSFQGYSRSFYFTHHRSISSLSPESSSSKKTWRTTVWEMTSTTNSRFSKASAEPSIIDSHSKGVASARPYKSWKSYESARRTSFMATPTSVSGHSNSKESTEVPRVSTESWPSAMMESMQLSLPSSSSDSDRRRSSGIVETKSLVLPGNPSQSSKATNLRQTSSTATKSTTGSTVSGTESSSTISAEESGSQSTDSYPEVIVPLGAQPPSKDSALVGVQFKPSLPWMWIVSQRKTTAQIFTYMPKLLANGIQMDPGSIKTKELRAQPVNQTLRTVYLAYIPKSKLSDARAALDNPLAKMSVDDLNAVEKQLLEQIEQAFDFSSLSSLSKDEPEQVPLNTRTALVSSFSGVAGLALLGFSVWFMQRCNRQRAERKKKKQRRNTIQSFSALSNSPVSLPSELAPAPARASSFYVGDPHGSSVTAFESDGVTGTYDVASAPFMSTHREASSTQQHDSLSHQAPPHSFGESESNARWITDPYSLSDLIPNVRPSSSMRRTSVHQRSPTYDRED
ncbi:hypothetical protein MYAM1_000785 [Malassezia yamatoensis]|uniref:Uncharacterized protein n=1 Tax=Malassezia yamatoensis TaxID=253288 RepID=A0AAJ5YRR3_9BASI|nr:hypothetical protein MYAM1_000785 [Malassezia yamatoensis]